MSRLPRVVASVCAVGLAVYALSVLLADPPVDDESLGPVRDPIESQVQAETRDRLIEYVRAAESPPVSGLPGDDLVDDDDISAAGSLVDLSEGEARRGFDHIMKRVEALGHKRRRLSQDEWRETYRAANDAFSALSVHLDARNASERAELEDAYARLKAGLQSVRVRGQKFGQH